MTTETDAAGRPPSAAELLRDGKLVGRWRLDPTTSRVEFRVRHFWHAITVQGWFETLSGAATVEADGTVSGRLVIDATTLNTENKQRDRHLRSAAFFDVEHHPEVTVAVDRATPTDAAHLSLAGALTAAGVTVPVTFVADICEAGAETVVLEITLDVDRTDFGMTWSPLRVAAKQATAVVTARFSRESEDPSA